MKEETRESRREGVERQTHREPNAIRDIDGEIEKERIRPTETKWQLKKRIKINCTVR